MARRRSEPTNGDAPTPESGEVAAPAIPAEGAADTPPGSAPEAVEPATAETTAGETPHDEHHDEYHDDSGPSFAARALTVLLLLLAGTALGIWGAPKLAPMLPSGLAPVASWLTPGQRAAEASIAELESRLGASIADLEIRLEAAQARLAEVPTTEDIAGRVSAAVGGVETRTTAELAELRETVGALDGAETRQRLSRTEAAIDGQAAELAAIKRQIEGGAAATTGALNAETTERIDLYRAEVEGLRAEMGALSDKVAALDTRIDDVAAEAERQVEAARADAAAVEAQAATAVDTATVDADLAQIRAALAAGLPYGDAADRLAERANMSVPEPLLAAAETGVTSLPALRDAFPDAAHSAIRASILASAGDGVLARSRAFLEAQVASRSLTPKEGSAPDAVLSRMEDRLRRGDLAGVLDEAEGLPTEAAAAMSGWLEAARLRLDAEAALVTVESGLAATN